MQKLLIKDFKMLSKKEFWNIQIFYYNYYKEYIKAYNMFYTELVGKTFKFNEEGKNKIKCICKSHGYSAFYNSKKIKIFIVLSDPITGIEKAVNLLNIPVYVEKEKFYFKKSAQFLIKNYKEILDNKKFYSYLIKNKEKSNYYNEYTKSFNQYKTFENMLNYNKTLNMV